MAPALAVVSILFLAQAAAPAAAPPSPAAPPRADDATPPADSAPPPPEVEAQAPAEPEPPEPLAPPPPLPPPPVEPRFYGYAGMTELSVALGYSSGSGFLGGAGFRRYVVDGVAPGVEASVQTGSGTTLGLLLGTLRLAPVRTQQIALVVTGRGGRVLLSHHDDGWGAGVGAGLIWFVAPHAGLELGYEILWLVPRSFCADLPSCSIQGPVVGLRLSL
jgi:hypothetical protein